MPLSIDISGALGILEEVKDVADTAQDMKIRNEMKADLKYLIGIFENPIFGSIGTLQVSGFWFCQMFIVFIILIKSYRGFSLLFIN
jgi:hypothetical protein